MSLDAVQSQRVSAPVGTGPMTQVMGRRWMVSAGHPLAAQAAAGILKAGGNAVDAGVAAGFMLGVVHPDMVSFAGVFTAFGMPPQQAVEVPRVASRSFPDSFWPHTNSPGQLDAEVDIPPETRAALADLGHGVTEQPERDWRSGAVCAIVIRPDGTRMAGADPRRGAHAIGW